MAHAGRAAMRLFVGLVADLVCSLITVARFFPLPFTEVLDVADNVLQACATTLVITGLFCLRPLSRHFAASFGWRVAQLVASLALFVLAALPISVPSVVPPVVPSPAATVGLTLATVAISRLLALFANREMLMGASAALGSLGAPAHEQERARSASALVVASSSLLVASLLGVACVFVLLVARKGSGSVPLVLGGLVACVSLVVSLAFALVVDVLVAVRIHALGTAFAEVAE